MTELSLVACAPSVDLSRLGHRHAVGILLSSRAGHLNHFHSLQTLNQSWLFLCSLLPVTELVEGAVSPGICKPLFSRCQSMGEPSMHAPDPMTPKV